MEKLAKKLTLHYIFIQAIFWITGCCTLAYSTVYLLDKGFTNTEIGTTLALSNIMAIVLQPFIAAIIDKSARITIRTVTVILMGISALLALSLIILPAVSIVISFVTLTLVALSRMQQSFITSLAMEHVYNGTPLNFSLCRGFGSFGFSIMSLSMGFAVEALGANVIMLILAVFSAATLILVALFPKPAAVILGSSETAEETEKASGLIEFAVNNKRFVFCVLSLVLIYLSHVFINSFTIQIVNNVGGTESNMGIATALAGFLELPAMALFPLILKKVGSASTIIKLAAIFMAIKALITLLAPNIAVVYIAQALQFFSYALLVPASIYYTNRVIAAKDKVKGQSCMDLAICVAGVIGNVIGGLFIDLSGVPLMLAVGTLATSAGVVMLFIFTDKDKAAE